VVSYDVWAARDIVDLITEVRVLKDDLKAAFAVNRKIVGTAIGRDVAKALADYCLTGKSARGSYPREVAVNLLRKLNIAAVPIPNCAFRADHVTSLSAFRECRRYASQRYTSRATGLYVLVEYPCCHGEYGKYDK
jgi:hypothetical protein